MQEINAKWNNKEIYRNQNLKRMAKLRSLARSNAEMALEFIDKKLNNKKLLLVIKLGVIFLFKEIFKVLKKLLSGFALSFLIPANSRSKFFFGLSVSFCGVKNFNANMLIATTSTAKERNTFSF